jgi:LPS export ABC transporter protein LptC/lipopolysaccharide transport protein LptA
VSKQKILTPDIARATEGIEFTEHREGKKLFTVNARRLIERKEGKNNLQSIEAHNFGNDGTRNDMIRSDYCEYSDTGNSVVFKENVFVRVDGGTEIRCNSLQYDKTTETVSTSEPFTMINRGLEGMGKGLTYSFAQQSFAIHDAVKFTLRPPQPAGTNPSAAQISARTSFYTRPEHRLRLSGAAEVAQEAAKLKGQTIVINFSSDEKEIEGLEASGGASYSRALDNAQTELQGDKIKIHFARGANAIDKMETFGPSSFNSRDAQRQTQLTAQQIVIDFADNQPRILKAYTAADLKSLGPDSQLDINGEVITATFQPQGQGGLDKLSVERNAKLQSRASQQAGDQMQADRIDLQFADAGHGTGMKEMVAAGDVSWRLAAEPVKKGADQNVRLLKCGHLKVDYQADGANPRELTAWEHCLLQMSAHSNAAREQKTITAEQFHSTFHPGSHQIDTFLAERHVKVISVLADKNTDNTRVSHSDQLIARFGNSEEIERLDQIGHFTYAEGSRKGESERARYEEASGIMHMIGKPVVWDEDARTYARDITFDRKKRSLLAEGDVKTIYKSNGPNTMATPFSTNSKEPVVITAQRLEFYEAEKKSIYSGRARAAQEGSSVQAERIEIFSLKQEFIAYNHVDSRFYSQRGGNNADAKSQSTTPTLVKADKMTYTQGKDTVRYEKNVFMRFNGADMQADTTDMFLAKDHNRVEKAILNGQVHIVQPEREGRGTHAEYYAVEDKIVLVGNLAHVDSKTKGKSSGKRLTFYNNGDRIFVESQ